ncbi:MAG: winged-helix domain-containing protein [Dehalococcoidia bacterium]
MYRLFLLSNPGNGLMSLIEEVSRAGFSCQVGSDLSYIEDANGSSAALPDAVLMDLEAIQLAQGRSLVEQCHNLKMPVLAVVVHEALGAYDPSLNPDDFIIRPIQQTELEARVKQAVYRVSGPTSSQVLRIGDLVIDLERYDVFISGRRITLTYKEFQLLVLLASNPGRVYTREVLLSQVWGYDYLGGTRTVDVHIRRLRSKIEDPDHSYVETIWNVGYRFKTSA